MQDQLEVLASGTRVSSEAAAVSEEVVMEQCEEDIDDSSKVDSMNIGSASRASSHTCQKFRTSDGKTLKNNYCTICEFVLAICIFV